jgi:hypothetical protein
VIAVSIEIPALVAAVNESVGIFDVEASAHPVDATFRVPVYAHSCPARLGLSHVVVPPEVVEQMAGSRLTSTVESVTEPAAPAVTVRAKHV